MSKGFGQNEKNGCPRVGSTADSTPVRKNIVPLPLLLTLLSWSIRFSIEYVIKWFSVKRKII